VTCTSNQDPPLARVRGNNSVKTDDNDGAQGGNADSFLTRRYGQVTGHGPHAGFSGSSLIESCLCSSPASTLSDARAASARRLTLFRTALPRTFFCTTCDRGRKR